jgi:hypothetical protein
LLGVQTLPESLTLDHFAAHLRSAVRSYYIGSNGSLNRTIGGEKKPISLRKGMNQKEISASNPIPVGNKTYKRLTEQPDPTSASHSFAAARSF